MFVLFHFGDRIKEKGLVLTQKVFLSGFLGYQKRKEKKEAKQTLERFILGLVSGCLTLLNTVKLICKGKITAQKLRAE